MNNNINRLTTLIATLEGGQLEEDLTEELRSCLKHISEMALDAPRSTIKTEIDLKISFQLKDGMIDIVSNFKSKKPAKPRSGDRMWLTSDGKISAQHPKQKDFFTPHEVLKN